MTTVEKTLKGLPKLAGGRLACSDHPDVAAVKVLGYGGGYGGLPGRLVPVCQRCLEDSREYFQNPEC